MSQLTLKTDHKWKQFRYGYEVPDDVKKEYEDVDANLYDGWIKYLKRWYHISDFFKFGDNYDPILKGWDGYYAQCAFWGLVIKVSKDGECYMIGNYLT